METYKPNLFFTFILTIFLLETCPLQAAETEPSPGVFSLESIAGSAVVLKAIEEVCSKYFTVNREQIVKAEMVFVNTGNTVDQLQFKRLLKVSTKKTRKQIATLGEADWCKYKKGDYEAVDPGLFK